MNEEHTFTIRWSVPDSQWEKARVALEKHGRGSNYDQRGLARYYLLYGDVDFVYDGKPFYGETYGADGINVSLLDLALALADTYLRQRFVPGGRAQYDQLDDDLRIEFYGVDAGVRLAASDSGSVVVVPRAVFESGVLTFLRDFAGAVNTHLEGALDWESMGPLREVSGRLGAN